jgi:hypothetical protein
LMRTRTEQSYRNPLIDKGKQTLIGSNVPPRNCSARRPNADISAVPTFRDCPPIRADLESADLPTKT